MPAKPKILHVTFDMAIGGTEQVIKQIIEGSLDACEHRVFCIDGKVGDLGKQLQEQGVEFVTYQRTSGLDRELIKYLRSYAQEQNIDVLHCHQYSPYSYGILSAIGQRAQVVFTEHGRFYPDVYSWKRRVLNPFFSLFTRNIIAISEATKNALVEYEWFPRQKIQVIYNGMAPGTFEPSELEEVRRQYGLEGKKVVGTVARMDTIKNHPMMLEGFAKTLKSHPDTKMVIVGDGPERSNTEAVIDRLGIQDSVVLTGFQARPAIFFALIDIFLLPSLSEGTSMTLLEAMANGKPTVVTRVGGNPEIVSHRETGFVCESGDVDAFSDHISELLEDAKLYQQMGDAALERYRRLFTLEHMTKAYLNVYQGLKT